MKELRITCNQCKHKTMNIDLKDGSFIQCAHGLIHMNDCVCELFELGYRLSCASGGSGGSIKDYNNVSTYSPDCKIVIVKSESSKSKCGEQMKELIQNLGKKMYPGSNTQKGKAYHTCDDYDVKGQAGNVKQRVELILKNIALKGLNGIDLGCNCGGITLSLAKAGAEMFGVDYDPQSIELAKSYAKKLKLSIKYNVQDIDINTIKGAGAFDFVIWLSHWMWMCQRYGYEYGLNALFELGKHRTILFFETSLGDGMAGNVMKKNGVTQDKIMEILHNCFVSVEKIGVDENWRKRPIFKCIGGKEWQYKGHKDNIIKRIAYNEVEKIQTYPIDGHKREVDSLCKLHTNKHFPTIKALHKNKFSMDYCGNQLKKLPKNWRIQAEEIISALKTANIVHRDIIPRNLLIENGVIKLIDFSWSGKPDENATFPGRLGTDYRKYPGFDDRYSLYKCLEEMDE